jgi:hypothetical protein
VPNPSQESGEWEIEEGVRCVVCPTCGFTFDAIHVDVGGGYSCPQCDPVDPGQESGDYCGCCGDEIRNSTDHMVMWCARCKPHIAGYSAPPWERTYEAINGEPCPFQVGLGA